jgi:triacylglycerol lipase
MLRDHRAHTLLGVCFTVACASHSPSYGMPVDSGTDASPLDANDAVAPTDAGRRDTSLPPIDAPHGPPYPIVLHHGFAGFRQIGALNYYYRVADDLRARGETVYEAEVSPFASPEQRGTELATFVDHVLAETDAAKIVLVAHSQGGLDARYLISTRGYGDRVALLATIATPHRGTRVADAVLGNVPGVGADVLDAVASVIGQSYNDVRTNADLRAAMNALSEAAAPAFNRANPDDPRVVYWSWTGRSNDRTGAIQCAGAHTPNDPFHVDSTNPLLFAFATFIEQGDPITHVNDGLVEVASAKWGTWMGCVPADHFDEVGQIAENGPNAGSGFDHIAFYRDVVSRIHAAGF